MQNFIKTIINGVQKWTNKEIDKLKNSINTLQNSIMSISDKKMNQKNPVGSGSFSMGRLTDSEVGVNSHAEGDSTTASGYASHAEGYSTTASGDYSHAEGYFTTASGDYSHAEGFYTTAPGQQSHAEGNNAIASGYCSHAEGSSTASGDHSHAEGGSNASGLGSHAEGWETVASGYYSHAEGQFTTAKCKSQHVQGEYNIPDNGGDENKKGKYSHIVGNGTSEAERSNAHTLDWNGVGWYQGGLQVGGNAQDDGAKTVLLEGDAIPVPETAEVGQIMMVKSVDENGKPVEWETTDISTSGGSGCVVSDTAPEDTSVLWIDTSDNSSDENLGGGNVGETEQLNMLIESDMLPAVHDANGAILTDENGNVILRY